MFKHVCFPLAVKEKQKERKVSTSFCWCSSVTELQKFPPTMLHFRLFQRWLRLASFESALLCADPRAVPVYTHWNPLRCRLIKGCRATYMLSDPRWSCALCLSVCRVPSLTQAAALLQSSVVHFVVAPKKVSRQLLRYSFYFLSIPKGNRSLFLFSLFLPFWTGTNNRPFPLHSWCWMSEGGSQRSRNILLEWYVESCSPSLPFFLSPVMDFKDAATIPCLKGNS